jgi:RNA polymerase sigma-70 factor (ECF subfamily)
MTENLSGLPPEQRRPLVLAALYGYTASEISEIDDIPVGTAKSRIRSALLKLRAEREVSDER